MNSSKKAKFATTKGSDWQINIQSTDKSKISNNSQSGALLFTFCVKYCEYQPQN